MHYRPEIDGLRAIAVLPVLFFHAGYSIFKGGYIGVDIFFVISGYLITSIISNEIKNNTFSISNFYERRARRILPALSFVILCCLPFAYLWLLPSELKSFLKSIIAVNFFSSNILFWKEIDYFSPAADLKPLLHTWSLAVEEQFYIFFPLLLLLFKKAKIRTTFLLIFALSLVSLILSNWASYNFPKANFFLLPTRAWELGAGALLAIITPPLKGNNYLSALGFLMVGYSIFFFDYTIPFPSFWTLVPVLGTALIIRYASKDNFIGRLLSCRPFVFIGLISYSLYLWHQPVFAFARIRSMYTELTVYSYALLIILSILLSIFSWYFIEKPFRSKYIFNKNKIFSISAICILFLSLLSVISMQDFITKSIYSKDTIAMELWERDRKKSDTECQSGEYKYIKPSNACVHGKNQEIITLIGDSHAMSIASTLELSANKYHASIRQMTYTGCMPITNFFKSYNNERCTEYNSSVYKHLTKNSDPEIIVMLARWTANIEGTKYNNGEGGVERGHGSYAVPSGMNTIDYINSENRYELISDTISTSVNFLLDKGKKVVLVYPIPEAGWSVPFHLAREMKIGIKRTEPLTTSFDNFQQRVKQTHFVLNAVTDRKNLIRIHPEDLFCNLQTLKRCIAQLNQDPLYYDSNHLNSIGAKILSDKITSTIKAAGWL